MWLFTCVYALVDSQGRALDELLAATRIVANMGPDAAVDAFCTQVSQVILFPPIPSPSIPCRARSERLAKPLPQVLQG